MEVGDLPRVSLPPGGFLQPGCLVIFGWKKSKKDNAANGEQFEIMAYSP